MQVLSELSQEEADIRSRVNEKAGAEKRMQERLEMLQQYESQLLEKAVRQKQSRFEVERVRKALIEDFEKSEQIDLLNERKRREKVLAFNKELANLIEAKRKCFEDEYAAEQTRIAHAQEEQKLHADIIAEERNRIMLEYKTIIGE